MFSGVCYESINQDNEQTMNMNNFLKRRFKATTSYSRYHGPLRMRIFHFFHENPDSIRDSGPQPQNFRNYKKFHEIPSFFLYRYGLYIG